MKSDISKSSFHNQHDHSSNLLQCPVCGEMTDSLKCYLLKSDAYFLILFFGWKIHKVVACPECMHKLINEYTWRKNNILFANLGFIAVLLDNWIRHMMCDTKGHSTRFW